MATGQLFYDPSRGRSRRWRLHARPYYNFYVSGLRTRAGVPGRWLTLPYPAASLTVAAALHGNPG